MLTIYTVYIHGIYSCIYHDIKKKLTAERVAGFSWNVFHTVAPLHSLLGNTYPRLLLSALSGKPPLGVCLCYIHFTSSIDESSLFSFSFQSSLSDQTIPKLRVNKGTES